MEKIVLLSPYPPVQNPRLVKEYYKLKDEGYNVKMYFAERDKWATDFHESFDANVYIVGGTRGSFFYNLSRLVHQLLKLIAPVWLSYHRVSWLLYIRVLSKKADLYIAHNLAALPIAIMAAKFHNAKCGFDAEDFHRQDITDNPNDKAFKLAKFMEDKYLPQVDYLTAASPLIAIAYQKLYPNIKPIVIKNVFSSSFLKQVNPPNHNKELGLFWFSQTIGKGRGIEDALKAIALLKKPSICLTLLGNIDKNNQDYFLNLANKLGLAKNQLSLISPVSPNHIFELANSYDIGLALEPAFCLNNNIALSNKIFTYLTAGLAVIASETLAQKEFLDQHAEIGKSYLIGDVKKLARIIEGYSNDRELLYQTKLKALQLAKESLNWEMESINFIATVKQTLAN